MTKNEREAPETTEWQQIGAIPIDTGQLALVDPQNLGDVLDYEPGMATYELVTNSYGVAVALVVGTGLGDGVYPIEVRFAEVAGAVRIAELRIRFLPHPVIGYELPL